MRIYNDGIYVADATLVSGTTFQYTFTEGQLLEGPSVITGRSYDSGEESPDSPALTIVLDTEPPVATSLIGGYDAAMNAYDVEVVGDLPDALL